MGKLCAALYSTYHKPSTLKVAKVARRFQVEICLRLRSPYLLWLRRDARRVLDAIRPWGCAMFSGDVMESLNAFLKDIFLTATSRGGGKGTPEEQLIELLFQAMSRGFLYKEKATFEGGGGLGCSANPTLCGRCYGVLGGNVGESVFYSHGTTGGG